MIKNFFAKQNKFKRRLVSIGLIAIAIATIILLNLQTKSQQEVSALLQKKLQENLNKDIEVVECYREVYGNKNEFFRYDCNYIGGDHKNMGLVYIDENKLTPPAWVSSTPHQLDFFAFYKNILTDGKNVIFSYNNFFKPDLDKLSQADIYHEKNLVEAVIRNKQ